MTLIETLYISTFSRTRKSRTSNGQGGWTESYGSAASIEGRMRPATATERLMAAQRQAEISHVFYCAADEDVVRGDHLTGEGRTYEVIAVREPSHSGHHLEVECRETQKGGEP